MPTLTVFTPTYNRANTLPRVFQSLQRQTCDDFLWLIVDDGSTDGTRQLIDAWRGTARFRIEYFYQPNGGKHNAHNAAVDRAATELFLILDSDDELLVDAVENITSAWREMSAPERSRLAGIWTLCIDPDGNIVDGPLAEPVVDASLQEMRYRDKINKEMLPCFVTEVLRQHRFPETAPGACPFIPEVFVWARITRDRPLRFLNVPCRVYHAGEGLSALSRDEYRIAGCIVYGYVAALAHDFEWFWYEPWLFISHAIQTARYGLFSRQLLKLARMLSWPARLLVYLAVGPALLLLLRDYFNGFERGPKAQGAPS